MKNHYRQGFTLVELSIVLIIIGLLITSVAAGNKLIENARIRSVIADLNEYYVALSAFELSYDQLPGDFNQASSFFASGANGNNNGLDEGTGDAADEMGNSWLHLTEAEIVSGSYAAGEFPTGKILGSQYSIDNRSLSGRTDNAIILESIIATDATPDYNGVVLPQIAFQIDNKLDDGDPGTGLIYAGNQISGGSLATASSSTCVDDNDDPSLNLTQTSSTANCRIIYWYD